MRYFVKWQVFDAIPESQIMPIKEGLGKQFERIKQSGKMLDGGCLLGIRGGYFIFELDKPAELLNLLGPVIWDNCRIESFPVATFEELAEYFRTYAEAGVGANI